jgi:hypothetical protein
MIKKILYVLLIAITNSYLFASDKLPIARKDVTARKDFTAEFFREIRSLPRPLLFSMHNDLHQVQIKVIRLLTPLTSHFPSDRTTLKIFDPANKDARLEDVKHLVWNLVMSGPRSREHPFHIDQPIGGRCICVKRKKRLCPYDFAHSETLLTLAVALNEQEIVDFLITKMLANPMVANARGETPLALALLLRRDSSIARFLYNQITKSEIRLDSRWKDVVTLTLKHSDLGSQLLKAVDLPTENLLRKSACDMIRGQAARLLAADS